jgi:hypothetical protein
MRRFLHLCLDRTPVIGLLMAALLFRALIPAGFMPTVASDGTIVMELCAGFTTKTVVVHLDAQADHADHVDPAGNEGSHPDAAHGDLFEQSLCGFAVAGTAAAPPSRLAEVVPFSPQAAPPTFHVVAQTPPSIHRSQTPRGPPLV